MRLEEDAHEAKKRKRRNAMQTTITARNLRLTKELRQQILRRLQFALGRFAPRIQAVAVAISDENGPRGGPDKRCQLRITTRGAGELILQRQGADLEALVARTVDRAGQAITRALERRGASPRIAMNELPWLQPAGLEAEGP
jgi:ribosome-associated translation inhibitor RaiA